MKSESSADVQVEFELKCLDEAAHLSYNSLSTQFEKAAYLEQTYKIIQQTMRNKDWFPTDKNIMLQWEDDLWLYYLTQQEQLTEFIPGGKASGWNLGSLLWIILSGLVLLNYKWRPKNAWRSLYDKDARAEHLPWVIQKHLAYSMMPVNSMTMNDLLGTLFSLTTRMLRIDYDIQLEIWVSWLHLRTCELTYLVTTKDLFNTQEFCAPRPVNPSLSTDDNDPPPTPEEVLYGVSDSFCQEMARLFAAIFNGLYRYTAYPRMMVCCPANTEEFKEMEIRRIDKGEISFPICDGNYIICKDIEDLFYEDPVIDGPIIKERWKKWVSKCLMPCYHDRSKMTLQKTGLVQALRPGEIARCKAHSQGVVPGWYEILKKCRPMGQLDHLDYHAFKIPQEKLLDYCTDLDGQTHPIKDSALLYLLDSYIYGEYKLRFIATFVKQEYQWSYAFADVEIIDYPLLIQILGKWDVYYRGQIYHTRHLARAFIIWARKMLVEYNGQALNLVDMTDMLEEVILGKKTAVRADPDNNNMKIEDSYWL